MTRRAVIAGATGLVGGELVKLLLHRQDYSKLTVLVRRRLELEHPLLEQLVLHYDDLEHLPGELFAGADVYCALGTTRKKAGSKERFRLVDYDYPMELGRLAKRYGAECMLAVTAMGASEDSIFFYSKVKGELERDLQLLKLPRLHLFRPSLIIGNRKEQRFGESAASKLAEMMPFLFRGPNMKYKPIQAKDIAEGMLAAAIWRDVAPRIVPSDEITALARLLRNGQS